jgi:hypothetical protein
MRKTLLLSIGVGATLVAAVFIGAAAATTGAPVFYDARYPAPASTGPERYDVSKGAAGQPGSTGGTDEAVAEGAPPTAPGSTPEPTSPAAPPTSAPDTGPTPMPGTDDPASDKRALEVPRGGVPPTAEEQRTWLAFQDIVRECMADAGQQYLYWEWWNPGPDTSNRFQGMPADLTAGEEVAWEFAMHGDSPGGDAYRWQDAGCWGSAVHVTDGKN